MGNSSSDTSAEDQAALATLVFPPPVAGKTRICMEGFKISTHAGRAKQVRGHWKQAQAQAPAKPKPLQVVDLIQRTYPDVYDSWVAFFWPGTHYAIHRALNARWGLTGDHRLANHKSSPLTWLEHASPVEGAIQDSGREGVWITPLGGRDDLCAWAHKTFASDSPQDVAIRALAIEPSQMDAWVDETPGSTQRK